MLPAAAACATFPAYGVRLINPYPAAGPADIAGVLPANRVLRLMQNQAAPAVTDLLAEELRQALARELKTTVVLERRPLERMIEAHRFVGRAVPDGRTLLFSGSASITVYSQVAQNAAFDPQRDFVPVALFARMPLVLVSGVGPGAASVRALIEAGRARPGRVRFGSSGDYSTAHLAGEHFSRLAGIDLLHVGYNGGTAAASAVLAGQIEVAFVPLAAALPYFASNRLRALGIADRARDPGLPEVPTLIESGILGSEAALWYGVFAPAGTPEHVIGRLETAIAGGLHTRERHRPWPPPGLQVVHVGAAEFARLVSDEQRRWARVVDAMKNGG